MSIWGLFFRFPGFGSRSGVFVPEIEDFGVTVLEQRVLGRNGPPAIGRAFPSVVNLNGSKLKSCVFD